MKNTFVVIIVFVLIVLGAVFFMGKGSPVEAPATDSVNNQETSPVSNMMPVLGTDPPVEEMIVFGVKEFTVSGQNFSFTPSLITVKKGDRVKITFNNTGGFHDFKIDEFGVAAKQAQSPTTEVLEFTADKVGSFEYYCSVGSHRAIGMKGTLKVE